MTTPMRHLLLIDTASRIAHKIIAGRRCGPPIFLGCMDGPSEVERMRASEQSRQVFDWIRHELVYASQAATPPQPTQDST